MPDQFHSVSLQEPIMTFRTFGVALILAFALLISFVASVLIATNLKNQGESEIRIASLFGANVTNVNSSPALRLAQKSKTLADLPQISDTELREIITAVIDRAHKGDADAALFVFELANLQRANTTSATDGSTTH